jgi:pimeloyl-ACP methyl ester carboxylesterase
MKPQTFPFEKRKKKHTMSLSSITTSIHYVGDQRIHLLEAGQQGTPEVLLIHGGLGDADLHWHNTLTALGASFHVYAPDLPGFQDESDPVKMLSLPRIMQWINDLLHSLNVEKVFLVGTSVGGLLARFYAAQYTATVKRLILVDGGQITPLPALVCTLINAPGLSSAFYRLMYHQTYSRASLRRSLYQHDLLTEEFFQILERASKGYMPLLRALLAEQWPTTRTPQCPTLIMWGKEDHLASPQEGEKLLREIPYAEFVLIEQSGHMPMLE